MISLPKVYMIQNFIITAVRNIRREGIYSLIKIAGLALGFGTSLVIFLYVTHQLSFDRNHPDGERTYRINQSNIWSPDGGKMQSTGPAVGLDLMSNYPEIASLCRINTPGGQIVRYERKNGEIAAYNEEHVLASDSTFFSFFGFQLREGDPATCLHGKNKVVLSDEAALRLFGEEPALGKLIQIGDDRTTVEVTGVTHPQPSNMHFKFDYLLSMPTNPAMKNFEWSWIFTQVVTYVKLKPGTDAALFDEKIRKAPDTHAQSTFQRLRMDYNEFVKERGAWELYAQPLKEVHLFSGKMGNRLGASGDIRSVVVLGAIGIFILAIAVVNFINLSTARAANRAKEVGVKKTLGWRRRTLIAQFQVEHLLITGVSLVLGLAVMELLRLFIEPVAGIEIPLDLGLRFGLVIILMPLIVGFLGGLYPSFFLTTFSPAQVLKGKVSSGFRSSKLRNTLVVFQFTISIALMAATLIIFNQLRFFQSQEVGFEKENLLIVSHAEKMGNQLESFRDEVRSLNGVESASVSMDIRMGFEDLFMREGDGMKLPIAIYKVDDAFFKTTKLTMASGRAFDERVSDVNGVIINETTAKLFGWTPEEALKHRIIYVGDEVGPQDIIGVVKDFHFQSLRQNIAPVVFFNVKSAIWGEGRTVLVRYKKEERQFVVNQLEAKWNALTEATPFEYSFYDDEVKMQYQSESRLGMLFSIFTGLAITIAIIGLVGLASYSAEQRKKEISVRKVFGASLGRIYVMLNLQYVKLMVVALLIATPVTWWLMQQWLNTYSYQIDISPWLFVMAGAVELASALICVGYLALRTASLNPAEVLKEQ
jgi:putative ABC transport system permease protein